MRTVLRYIDGRAIWSENVPASPGSSKIGGSLVTGKSAQQLHRESVAEHKAKVKAAKQ